MIPENGAEPRMVFTLDGTPDVKTHRFPYPLPGGKHALYTHGLANILSYDDASVALLTLETGEIRILMEGGTSPKYVPTGHMGHPDSTT